MNQNILSFFRTKFRFLIFISYTGISAFIIYLAGCDMPADFNPPGDSFAGYITFTDTNLIISNQGYYAVSIYTDSTFQNSPVKSDSLIITRDGNVYSSGFKMTGVGEGKYYIAATWNNYPNSQPGNYKVLGIYGCDTSKTCLNPSKIIFPNFEGATRNFLSSADTTKEIK